MISACSKFRWKIFNGFRVMARKRLRERGRGRTRTNAYERGRETAQNQNVSLPYWGGDINKKLQNKQQTKHKRTRKTFCIFLFSVWCWWIGLVLVRHRLDRLYGLFLCLISLCIFVHLLTLMRGVGRGGYFMPMTWHWLPQAWIQNLVEVGEAVVHRWQIT